MSTTLIGGLFLGSALFKLIDFLPFVIFLADALHTSLAVASAISKGIVFTEFLLGGFLVSQLHLRSFTIPASVAVLCSFSLFLIYRLAIHRGGDDCGCFGSAIAIPPLAGLVKNLAAIFLCFLISSKRTEWQHNYKVWLSWGIGFAAFAGPFLALPMRSMQQPKAIHLPIDLTPLYESMRPGYTPPEEDLRRGKHIVGFFSLECGQCRLAATIFHVLYQENMELPLFMVLNGRQNVLPAFLNQTQAEEVPYILFRGPADFIHMAGTELPAIYWIHDGIAEKRSRVNELDGNAMKQWLME